MSFKVYLALVSLAICAFAIGTTEFVIVGLLPTVASDLGITLTRSATLVSGYAAAIAIGTPFVTAIIGRFPKKGMLLLLMAIFTLGNLLAALAQTYGLLMSARVVTALAHGVFFAIAATVATDMVPATKKATALSLMFTGLTVATIIGVPFGTYIGQQFGWRFTFAAVAVLGAIAFVAILSAIDTLPASAKAVSLRSMSQLILNRRIVMALLMTALGFGGTFPLFTYISPILEEVSGYSESAIALLLLAYGMAVAVGNLVGGKLADRQPVKALRSVFLLQGVVLLLQMWLLPSHSLSLAALLLLGFFAFMMSPGVQAYIVILAEKYAPSAKEVASALNISAFNVGIAAGSALGGYVVKEMTYLDTAWVGAIMVGIALVLASYSYRLDQKTQLIGSDDK
ncbi:MFS transporter [Brevibacillus sp. SAFN-007a]|uniref:MFS transporter n=1 Tax=Brevibacillus sp. SAFN-007a TaxID=3436862 RepID=UPI003F81F70D